MKMDGDLYCHFPKKTHKKHSKLQIVAYIMMGNIKFQLSHEFKKLNVAHKSSNLLLSWKKEYNTKSKGVSKL